MAHRITQMKSHFDLNFSCFYDLRVRGLTSFFLNPSHGAIVLRAIIDVSRM